METKQNSEQSEALPVESPQTEIIRIMEDGDPDLQLAILEKKAALAMRFSKAINTILVTQTYPEDWQRFGEGDKQIVCLSSAGAERVARHFGIKIYEVKSKKEEFTDTTGKGYRYVFEGNASMGDRLIYAQGTYSTRDKFLGFKQGEYKALEDINENDIRDAAYHIFTGNAIKGLLGLRGIPASRFTEIMGKAGENPDKSNKVNHGNGTQGGTTKEDTESQRLLAQLLIDIANAGYEVIVDENGNHDLDQTFQQDPIEAAKLSCKNLTSFKGKDGTMVTGLESAKLLKGKRLDFALKNLQKLWDNFNKKQGDKQ